MGRAPNARGWEICDVWQIHNLLLLYLKYYRVRRANVHWHTKLPRHCKYRDALILTMVSLVYVNF